MWGTETPKSLPLLYSGHILNSQRLLRSETRLSFFPRFLSNRFSHFSFCFLILLHFLNDQMDSEDNGRDKK